jgi:hypothetical protein
MFRIGREGDFFVIAVLRRGVNQADYSGMNEIVQLRVNG